MKNDTTKTPADVANEKLFDNWFDPVETELRTKVRGFIETMIEEELEVALARPRYGRRPVEDGAAVSIAGHRHGRRIDRYIRTDGDHRSACPDLRCGRQDGGMEEQDGALLSTAHSRRRCANRLGLSLRNQHAPGPPGVGGPVWRRRG